MAYYINFLDGQRKITFGQSQLMLWGYRKLHFELILGILNPISKMDGTRQLDQLLGLEKIKTVSDTPDSF